VSAAPDYSIVLPAYNEAALLPATLVQLREAMAEAPLAGEVVVCDNNSTDATAELARAAGARVAFEPVNQISSGTTAPRPVRADGLGCRRSRLLHWNKALPAEAGVPPARSVGRNRQ
jgi:glycosyltransferase involved in cell wall biosynthesis